MTLAAGTHIGKYTVERELGHGGFGVIYVARDPGLDREVALKILRSEHVSRRELVQRFLQEARAAAKIDHPGIVTVFECGVVDDSRSAENGTVYIAMELLRGETLAQRVKRGRLPVAMALGLCQQAAGALAAAHRAGIVHRDLKPDNVFLCPDRAVLNGERVKLLDFGIAKLVDPGWAPAVKTHSMTLLGTPMYMSPEQCKSSAKVDARSDIYTLGCIVYELVCGRPPYDGDSGELIAKHQLAAVPDPRVLAPDLPASLDALLRAMLAKAPEDRPQNMEQVEAQLEMCLAHNDDAPTASVRTRAPTAQPPPAPPPGALMTAGTIDVPAAQTTMSSGARGGLLELARRQRSVLLVAAGAVTLGVLIALVVAQAGGHAAGLPAPIDAAAAPERIAVVPLPADARVVVPVAIVPDAAIAIDAAALVDAEPEEVDLGEAAPPSDARIAGHPHTTPGRGHPRVPPEAGSDASPATCDYEEHKQKGSDATNKGEHAKALFEFEAALKCKPGDLGLTARAYMEACQANQPAKAKRYFARLPATGSNSQQTLVQMCARVGIDPH